MFVVDGYNAIRRVARFADIESRDGLRAGRDALATAILASGILGSEPVTVIFDGRNETGTAPRDPHPKLKIRFSRAADTADEDIVRYLAKHQTSAITVVTADHDLAFEVRRLGAAVIAPEHWNALKLPKRRSRGPARERREKPSATAADVAYWLEVFEDDND